MQNRLFGKEDAVFCSYYSGGIMMNTKIRECVSLFMAGILVLSMTGCDKKKTGPSVTCEGGTETSTETTNKVISGDDKTNPNNNVDYSADIVKDTDPFYTVEETRIEIPTDPDKEVDTLTIISDPVFLEDRITLQYFIRYKFPPEIQAQVDQIQWGTPEEYQKYMDLVEGYEIHAWAVYDADGKYLFPIEEKTDGMELGALFELPDGRMGMFKNEPDFSSDPIGYQSEILIYSSEGNLLERRDSGKRETNAYNIREMILPDNKILLISSALIMCLDKDANILWEVSPSALGSLGSGSGESVFVVDGKIYVMFFRTTENEKGVVIERAVQEIDINTGELTGEKIELSPNLPNTLFQGNNAVYGIGANGVLKADLFTGSREAVLNWNETDVNCTHIRADNSRILSNGEFEFFTESNEQENEGEESVITLVHFQRAAVNPHAGKTLLHLSAYNLYDENDLIDRIIEYNTRPEGKARVLFYDYSDDADRTLISLQTEADMGYKVYQDLRSGTGPDILMNFTDFGEFENGDVLEDLNTYIDGGNGIDRSLYFDNVFRAYETNGKLYQMPLSFVINGIIGNKTYCGERYGWTYDEFDGVLNTLPADLTAFCSLSAKDFIVDLLTSDMSHFVDYEKKEVHFDSEEFIKLLEIAKKCEVSRDLMEELDDMSYHDPLANAITQNICAMTDFNATSLQFGYGRYSDINGGNVSFVGYPSSEGKGLSAKSTRSVAISANSRHKEESWDFIKFLLEDGTQKQFSSIPVSRNAQQLKDQAEIDEYNKTKAEFPNDRMMWRSAPLDETASKEWTKIIENVHTKSVTYPSILMVVNEEAPAFFSGQKSAKDVAGTIQKRASIIVQEN